jgi:aminoglycoside phosphotransferase (APT) family kinase protein
MYEGGLPPLLDVEALQVYLQHALGIPGRERLQVERIQGGHSNETFFVIYGTRHYVLRRPPAGPLLPTAHDIGREYRVLQTLAGTVVPVPRPLLFCEDVTVIGAPFYLMERVHGVAIRDRLPPALDADASARTQIAEELIDRLVDLHAVDWHAIGFRSPSNPQGYLERQLRRWSSQLTASYVRPLPDLEVVTRWLYEHLPQSPPATIVHGDYRLDNALFDPHPPARILALVDWEMATVGDPWSDLGYLLSFWREPGDPPFPYADPAWLLTGQPGFPSRAALVERYARRSGRAVPSLVFYVTLAIWKLAILLEGSYKRYLAGTTDDPFFPLLEFCVPALAARALHICLGQERIL